eukprot:COSAG02_NODE_24013_length_700_cov_0.501661_1_plen_79_part_10
MLASALYTALTHTDLRVLPLRAAQPGTCVYYAGARCWLSFNPIIALSSAHLAFRRMCLAETQPFDTCYGARCSPCYSGQ